eukprot:scaffold9402_cov71-Skeletonema_marinoi.AAC.1
MTPPRAKNEESRTTEDFLRGLRMVIRRGFAMVALQPDPRVNKQGPRREFPPNFYLVKKSSPGTVSSANSGVASQYRFESSLKQEARAQGGAKNNITTTGIWNGEQSSGVL